MKLVTSATMRQIDREAIDNRGIPSDKLMENAGSGIALRILTDLLPRPESAHVCVFCGKGNNGGDGFVIARHLAQSGVDVQIFFIGPARELSADARLNFDRAEDLKLTMTEVKSTADLPEMLECDLAVDAVFGTGFSGAPRGIAADIIGYINDLGTIIVAVDLPSGLNSDTGDCEGAVIEADYTYTLALPKFGLFLSPGREASGDVEIIPIGIPDDVIAKFNLRISLATIEWVSSILPPRKPDGHKGDFGRVLTVAGSTGMTGAAAMVALSSLRAGCGLAKLACPKSTQPVLAAKLTEVMTRPMPDVRNKGVFALRGLGEIRQLIAEHDSVILGPGIGRHHETSELMRRLVAGLDKPAIIDADGLNAFEGHVDILCECKAPLVLTPHPGEFTRLCGSTPPTEREIEARAEAAIRFAIDHSVVVVLKGSPTVTAAPDGRCCLNPTGNHGMATGGSGDVLSGIIGTLLAQCDDPFEAAGAGVFIHGLAGDLAADKFTPRAMIAGDMIDFLPEVFEVLE
ncbi:MAG: NAD(P)H-hydrate dehydratase [Candidatus Zixiibacteriota bacterium]